MRRALFPGSLGPFTKGHLDAVERTTKLFDEVVIGVFISASENSLFPSKEKMTLIAKAMAHFPNVKIIHQENQSTVETIKEIDADALVRRIRNIEDFEYEREIAQMDHHLNEELGTVFLLTGPEYSHVSSSILREVLHFGGDVSSYLPPVIDEALAGERGSSED